MAGDEDLLAETNTAAREMTRRLLDSALPSVEPIGEDATPAVLISVVRVWARRGVDLRTLMRGYRRAQTEFWRYWMPDVAARIEDPALRMAVLEHSWDRISAWYEVQLDHVEEIYAQERDRWLRGAQARRAELVRSILAGETVEREQASVTLGYDLRRVHTALVLWAEGEQGDALALLEETVRDLAHAVGDGPTLVVPAGSSALWAWIAMDAEPADAAWYDLAGAALPPHVHVALGHPARGVDGLRSSHQDAQLVRRLMPFAERAGQLVAFDDVELACLMAGEPEAMRRVVAHELGALARREAGAGRLRETLRVYLACGGNAREAAERLNMHKNTVHYRLARIEELRGRPIAERRLELEVALLLAHTLGDRVLPDDATA